jgi:two-component system CheB/CheR fusion protein
MKVTHPKATPVEKLIKSDNLFPVVGVGASAGGLDAFKQLLKAIPIDSGMAFVLVQHLDPNHESMLTEILQKVTAIPVLEIADDIKVQPNHIYVIPSNKVLVATDGVLLLAPRPEKSKTERYLPIDIFFTSLAIVHQSHSIGIILSGTGTDGTLGLKAIKDYGGITLVQDEESAAYPGMPNSAVDAGVVDFILSPGKIPDKLLEVNQIITNPTTNDKNLPLGDEEVFRQINALLRVRKGTDFTYYKQTTIRRRILRRMAINKNEIVADYLNYLRKNKPEQDVLYQDLLIPVTSFFRDSSVFDNLCSKVFPSIINNKQPTEAIRIWVAGCSTGEEAYSMAMCIKEFLGSNTLVNSEERVQIFASDLSEPAILKARTGIYSKMEVAGLSTERLNEFFTKTDGSYQVNRKIRDLCIFATHNFLKDPPFGKLDLVSCRNVLIYMEPYLQKKAMTTFHYALNPKGFLLLGKSETTGGVPDLFASIEKNDKLYSRKDAPSRFVQMASHRTESNLIDNKNKPNTETMRSDFQKTADDIMLSKYSPAGVVINEAMDIVQFRGSTSRFLEQSSGKPSHNLLVMAKNGLAFELRNIIHKTKKGKITVVKENIPVEINGNLVNITIEAIPLPNTIEPHCLIVFHDSNSIDTKQEVTENKKPTRKIKTDDKDLRIKQLELELTQAREDMRSITEDQEAANEELQSANEELLSGSEELQSLNEELETSKEELQSTNEELMVVNHEMIGLNEQIAEAKNYAESIVANIREPLLVLDKNLRVKTANKSFYNTFKVNEKETENVLIYDLGNKQWDIPALRTLLEKILPEKSVFNDFEVTHTFRNIGELIMLLNAREVINKNTSEKLILLSIEDITEKAFAQKKIEESKEQFQAAIAAGEGIVWTNNATGEMEGEQLGWALLTGQTYEEYQGYGWTNVVHPDDAQPTVEAWNEAVKERKTFIFEHRVKRKDGQWRNFSIRAIPLLDVSGSLREWVGVHTDITERKQQQQILAESEYRYHNMIYSSPSMIAIFKGEDMIIEIANDAIIKSWNKGKNIIGKSLFSIMPELIEQGFAEILADVYKTGIPFHAYETPIGLIHESKIDIMHFTFVYQAQRNINGEIEGVAVIANEVTPQALASINLKESEERFRSLSNNVPVHIFIIEPDEEASISYWNKNWLDYTGQSFEKAIGNRWSDMVHPDDVKVIMDIYLPAFEKKDPYFIPAIRIKRHDGEYLWHSVQANPRNLPNGDFMGYMGIGIDNHEQKLAQDALKQSEKQFRMMAELMPQKIWTSNAAGNKDYFNRTLLDYAGMSFDELKGKGWAKIVHPDDFNKNKKIWGECIKTGKDYESENRIRRKDGKYLWHLTRAVALRDDKGKITMWIGSKTEIQEQKEERELLEIAVLNRTAELQKANEALIFESLEKEKKADELVKINKELEAFAFVSSHDLQEPLRKIQTFTDRILTTEKLSDTGKNYFLRIEDAAERMRTLIEDLLSFSSLTTSERKFEITNLNTVVAILQEDFKEIIDEKKAIIESEKLCEIKIIVFQFQQLMQNLISNALKFSRPNVPPHIIIKSRIIKGNKKNHQNLNPENTYCHISVADNGIGFEEEYNNKVFEVFQRLHGKEKYAGTGIGLAIVKKIVENHHGEITVESKLNKGTTFHIYLPKN